VIGAVAFTSPYGCWPLFGEPGILTAPAQDLGSYVDLRGEIEDDRVCAADRHPVARSSAELEKPVLDANAVESIGEVADRFGVAEVGLAHPALGLLTTYSPQVALPLNLEFGLPAHRLGLQHDSGCSGRGLGSAAGGNELSQCVRQLPQALSGLGRDREDRPAARGQIVLDELGKFPRVWHVDLVQSNYAWPIGQSAMSREFCFNDVQVMEGISSRLHGRAVDDMD
jgi:hypothetical protein